MFIVLYSAKVYEICFLLRLDLNGSKNIVWDTVNNNPSSVSLNPAQSPFNLATTYLCDSLYPSLIPADPAVAMAVSLKHKL